MRLVPSWKGLGRLFSTGSACYRSFAQVQKDSNIHTDKSRSALLNVCATDISPSLGGDLGEAICRELSNNRPCLAFELCHLKLFFDYAPSGLGWWYHCSDGLRPSLIYLAPLGLKRPSLVCNQSPLRLPWLLAKYSKRGALKKLCIKKPA